MNSVSLDVVGGKIITFKDGGRITYTPHQDKFLNSLWGTLIHLITGDCEFTDEANGITASYSIGGAKGYGKDYFVGEIKQHGKVVSKLFGTYMGYIEFDGVRYWDIRKARAFGLIEDDYNLALESDWRKRIDSVEMRNKDVDQAQINKDALENRQRADRKLREAANKRRQEGGAKIDYSVYPNHPLNQNKMTKQ